MTTAKSNTKLWSPIHKLTYTSGETAWQVACMVNGKRIREAFPTKEEAETRAAQIRQMVDNEGAAAFSLPAETRAEAAKCVEMVRPYNASITEACQHFVEKVLKFREAPAVAMPSSGCWSKRGRRTFGRARSSTCGAAGAQEIGKEHRLEYVGKMKREEVLAQTPTAPWQLVRSFCAERPHADGWRNLLVWGDNLLGLRELLADQQGLNRFGK